MLLKFRFDDVIQLLSLLSTGKRLSKMTLLGIAGMKQLQREMRFWRFENEIQAHRLMAEVDGLTLLVEMQIDAEDDGFKFSHL